MLSGSALTGRVGAGSAAMMARLLSWFRPIRASTPTFRHPYTGPNVRAYVCPDGRTARTRRTGRGAAPRTGTAAGSGDRAPPGAPQRRGARAIFAGRGSKLEQAGGRGRSGCPGGVAHRGGAGAAEDADGRPKARASTEASPTQAGMAGAAVWLRSPEGAWGLLRTLLSHCAVPSA